MTGKLTAKKVSLYLAKLNRVIEVELFISVASDCELKIKIEGLEHVAIGKDFINCLNDLREHILEPEEAFLMINACRKDFLSSRMARQMSNGLSGYLLEKGKQARMADLVSSLDFAEVGLLTTVNLQRQFHNEWIESFRNRQC
ncbi:hypothetical protein [Parachitinimonas caeni]|uniref:Uncharacterized protein n=1 Tax=Parachitinimonas caeni TaxID=3031301 RepID=A0ABT7E416_9NEIS|nr:hypothetical protein [Parachitinimonas caeni]MDK2127048.1 hypothetical protein [Parachitinimonas caeni]